MFCCCKKKVARIEPTEEQAKKALKPPTGERTDDRELQEVSGGTISQNMETHSAGAKRLSPTADFNHELIAVKVQGSNPNEA